MATHTAMAQGSDASMRSSLEQRLGIIHFVSTKKHGWSGQSRTRFTDFQVNEITKDGEVVHLNVFYNTARELARAASQGGITKSDTQNSSRVDKSMRTVSEGSAVVKSQEPPTEEKVSTPVEGPPTGSITESDKGALVDLVGQETADKLIALYAKIQQTSKTTPNSQGDVNIATAGDKSQRSQVHAEIRRIFDGKIDTTTISSDSIKAMAARGGNQSRGGRSANNRAQNGSQNASQGGSGPYLHFSLYKENKDTIDALTHMAKTLRIHPKAFGAAGTKDRRAVTVQRVSIKGRNPASLIFLNERIGNVKIGDFKYAQHPIRLNDHDGNEFVIVLKNCVFSGTENLSFEEKLSVAKSTIDSALAQVIQRGFINYYGTQRFGTHQIGTQEIGMKILKEDFSGAIQALLAYDPLILQVLQDEGHARAAHKEDVNRARACSAFLKTKDSKAALDYLPPRCHVEKAVIQHLGKNPTDFVGALMSINRSMRTMYGHAYQSLVWNFVASKRWERYGTQVVNGDIVLVKSKSASMDDERDNEASQVWEDEIAAAQNYGSVPHAVTEDDLQDNKYSIYDVVLPSPGWDVTYPQNDIGDFYVEFMSRPENGGLDPYNMRRHQRDFSLPGSYRKLMGKLKRVPTASVKAYTSDLEQLVPTDLDIIRSRRAKERAEPDTRQQSAATSWHTFTQNVRQDELQESKKRAARHEAEGPAALTRIDDTWVQISVDGSDKRIRIARDNDAGMNESRPTNTNDGKSTQIKNDDINMNTTATDQQDGIHAAQDQQLNEKDLGSSIMAAITAQNSKHQDAQSRPRGVSPQSGPTNSEVTIGVDESHSISQTPTSNPPCLGVNPEPNQGSARSQSSTDTRGLQSDTAAAVPTSIVATDEVESTKTESIVPADSTDPKKIAVILRFALDTSQYATIVVRELQGTPSVNENSTGASDSSAFT